MSISENLNKIKATLPENVKLVAVSKFKPNSDLLEAYEAGQKDFGENYVQELVQKAEDLPKDINWHFIGHLQSNKVKYIAPFVHLIHSVDSLKLLKEINKQAQNNNRIIDCLLQIHIAEEETKTGLSQNEFLQILEENILNEPPNVNVIGVMGMSTFTDDKNQVKQEFKSLNESFLAAKNLKPELKEVSMGMSGDYLLAIQEGSTMVRIGSTIFGSR